MKRCLSFLLAVAMVIACAPVIPLEVNAATVASGDCSDNLTWTLDEDGVMTISGTGAMDDYATASSAPWHAYRASIQKVVIEDGVTAIGARTFYNCTNLFDVSIGKDVDVIGTYAFRGCTILSEITIPANVVQIDGSAFRVCSLLETVTFEGNAPTVGNYVFDGCVTPLVIKHYEDATGFDVAPWTAYTACKMHSGEWVVEAEASCTAEGSRYMICTVCGETTTETIPMSHNYVGGICTLCGAGKIFVEGTCGSTTQWGLDVHGNLYINGTGAISSYSSGSAPWYTYRDRITNIVIADTITSISSGAFYGLNSLESITIPFVGYTRKTATNTYQYPFGYIFGTTSYDGGVSTPQNYYGSSTDKTTGGTYYIPSSLKSVTVTGGEILYGAFYGCANLTSVTIGDGATCIGGSAFYNCSSLESVEIPDSVTSIGSSAFYNCSNLASVVIPDSVTSIGTYAFGYCSSLTSVVIPESVTSIGDYAFCGCSRLESVVIPDSVESIGSSAFYNCSNLASIEIPDSVTSIGTYAFYNCSSLTSVVIPESVTSIGNYAFYDCSSLESVEFLNSATSIGDGAFRNCTGLISIEIPDSVTSIGSGAFSGCSNLETITLSFVGSGDSTSYQLGYIFGTSSYDGGVATKQYQSSSSYKTYYIPSSLKTVIITGTYIGYGAFYNCSNLTSVIIGNGVTSIGGSAFYGCTRLSSVIIPDSVNSIGSGAFYDCSSLEHITIPFVGSSKKTASSTYQYPFGYIFGTSSGGGATEQYYYGSSTTSTTKSTYYIPSSLKSVTVTGGEILYGAFYNCKNITSITIGDGATCIGDWAFYNCSSLESVEIPDSVTSIGSSAFSGCSSLANVEIPDSITSIGSSAFSSCSSLTNMIIPDSITAIPNSAFYNCSNLASVLIPDSVESIGSYAFSGCSSLANVVIPDSIKAIPNYAFSGCSSLTSVVIPDSVESIGSSAFSGCSSLTSVVIPDSVTSIGSSAFSGCSSLTSVVIPDSITSIQEGTFSGCSSLEHITIPFVGSSKKTASSTYQYPFGYIFGTSSYDGGVATQQSYYGSSTTSTTSTTYYIPSSLKSVTVTGGNILYHAFYNCSNLTSVTIGDSVTSIGDYAFSGCSSLTGIWVDEENPNYSSDSHGVLFNKDQTTLIRAPGAISGRYTIPAGVTSISSSAFSSCSSLESVVISDSVTSIGEYAFSSCSSLTSVVIPDSVKSIDSYAFYDCGSLTSVVIPDSVTSIGAAAFNSCSSLESVVIGDSVTSIGNVAFAGCSSLTSVVIPDSVKSIGDSAFYNCSSLRHVAYTGTKSQWNSMSIGSSNTNLTNATRHYETTFEAVDNCVECGVYCPVCEEFITRTEKENGAHSYTDIDDFSCNDCDFVRTITGISLSSLPEKLGYLLFEDLNLTGSKLLVTFSDGSTGDVALTEQMVTGFDPATIGQQQLTVSFGGVAAAFTVEVLAQMPDSVELLTKPSKLSYIVGDALDLTGLTLKALYGAEEAIVNASDVTAQADMTVAGVQLVTVTFEGKSATFEVYVHEKGIVTVDSSLYPESSHNYSNNISQTKTLTVPGATKLVLTFNSSSYTESNYDYVYVLDGAENQIAKYSGNLANIVVTVPGDTVKIKLTSDSSNVNYGYKFSSIQAEVGMIHPETAAPSCAPTCTEPGFSDGVVCAICGEVITQQVEIPATGHDTVNGVCQICDFGKNVAHTLNDVETYYSTVEGALANATGGTIKLLADVTAGAVVLEPGVTLDLNGHTLTADVLIALNGAAVTDGGTACTGGGLLKVAKNSLMMGAENGNGVIPVWNGVDGYVFTKVTFQQMARTAGSGAAQYIFLPTFSNAEAAALMADGGTDNGLKFKVGLTWSDGQCQQFYTYSDELVKQVFDGTGRWVFSLNITGIAGITDMVASATIVTDSYAQAASTNTAVTAG